MIRRKRHALLGTACALGLVVVPVTGSAVVVAVTAPGSPKVVPTQLAAPLAAAPATASFTSSPRDGRGRPNR
jgi:hypothetical protein